MQKVLYVFSLLFFLSACHLKEEETFVNPVFYGKMVSLSDLWDVKITPTTLDKDNRHGTTWHEDCEMWENEPKKVVLRCTHQLNKVQPENSKTEEHTTYVIEISTPKYINRTHYLCYRNQHAEIHKPERRNVYRYTFLL